MASQKGKNKFGKGNKRKGFSPNSPGIKASQRKLEGPGRPFLKRPFLGPFWVNPNQFGRKRKSFNAEV